MINIASGDFLKRFAARLSVKCDDLSRFLPAAVRLVKTLSSVNSWSCLFSRIIYSKMAIEESVFLQNNL